MEHAINRTALERTDRTLDRLGAVDGAHSERIGALLDRLRRAQRHAVEETADVEASEGCDLAVAKRLAHLLGNSWLETKDVVSLKRSVVGAQLAPVDAKFTGSATSMRIRGYASTFGTTPDSYGDIVAPGAFATAVSDARGGRFPRMLLGHGGMGLGAWDLIPVGCWVSVAEDRHGLCVEGRLAPTGSGRALWELINMTPYPALNSLSIGYVVDAFETNGLPSGVRRRLTKISLHEISIVSLPANRDAVFKPVSASASEKMTEALAGLSAIVDRMCASDLTAAPRSTGVYFGSAELDAQQVRQANDALRALLSRARA